MASERKKLLRDIAEKIGAGENREDLKRYFVENLGAVNPSEIAFYQDEFIQDGVAQKDYQTLLYIGLEIFRDAVQNQKHT